MTTHIFLHESQIKFRVVGPAFSWYCVCGLTGSLAVLATAFGSSGQASSQEANQEPGHD